MRKKRNHFHKPGYNDINFQEEIPDSRKSLCFIKFKHGDFRDLRQNLLQDLSREYFAVLLGKSERIEDAEIINVYDITYLRKCDYDSQSLAFLRIKKDFVYQKLVELTSRYDVDTIIDVHTHPFCESEVSFSGTDDADEKAFFYFLKEKFDNLRYASIVLSQKKYSARIWDSMNGKIVAQEAQIKTQTKPESILSSRRFYKESLESDLLDTHDSFLHRSTLALGLDVMRQITGYQVISVVGVGGLGSVIAEHLIHTGFSYINLIDPDILEISNMNRIVGAYYEDAIHKDYKVDVVKRHLLKINPRAQIRSYRADVHSKEIEKILALSDWILIATDNHSSRFKVQQMSIKYFVPIISAGVNISVQDGKINDMSGEVITARPGDNLCLNCLGRINPIRVAQESHPDQNIREQLVKRGYVSGQNIKEPAVKTLNTMIATLAVEILVNQYTERQKHIPIMVYEDNFAKSIYEDMESIKARNKNCYTCHL